MIIIFVVENLINDQKLNEIPAFKCEFTLLIVFIKITFILDANTKIEMN